MHNHKSSFAQGVFIGAASAMGLMVLAYKKRKQVNRKLWMWRAKMEIFRRMRALEMPDQESFEETVDAVLKTYRKGSQVAAEEIDRFASRLKKNWKYIKKRFEEKIKSDDEEEDEDDEE